MRLENLELIWSSFNGGIFYRQWDETNFINFFSSWAGNILFKIWALWCQIRVENSDHSFDVRTFLTFWKLKVCSIPLNSKSSCFAFNLALTSQKFSILNKTFLLPRKPWSILRLNNTKVVKQLFTGYTQKLKNNFLVSSKDYH